MMKIIIEADLDMTQKLDLADKNIKTIIIIVFHIFKKVIQGKYKKTEVGLLETKPINV